MAAATGLRAAPTAIVSPKNTISSTALVEIKYLSMFAFMSKKISAETHKITLTVINSIYRYIIIITFIVTCTDCYCNNNRPLLAKAVEELCANIPHGIYTLSIVQKEFANDDKYGRTLRDEMLFGAQTRAFDNVYSHSEERTDNRLLEYYCLTDSSYMQLLPELLNAEPASHNYPFETEQIISGHVKHTFKKVDDFTLKVFIPSTAEMQDVHVDANRFNLRGLDFCDGTAFVFQAVKKNGSDKFLQLYIDSLQYPKVSAKKYHVPFLDSSQIVNKRNSNGENVNLKGYIQLDEVVAKGKFRPINRMKFSPDRALAEDDPLFEKAPTMDILLKRMGVHGSPEVMLDGNLLDRGDIADVMNLDPLDIKKIEYFLPSNYEMFGNLAGIANSSPIQGLYGQASLYGLLMIWTKSPTAFSRFRLHKPLSVVTVKQLGYMPKKSFEAKDVNLFDTTKYWNPHFVPQEFNENILKDITLEESQNYIIKIEGISDEGQPISKQIYY